MLDPRGNTGVYLIYQYVRVFSIIAKSEYGSEEALAYMKKNGAKFVITHDAERELALTILRLPETLAAASGDLAVNRVCD
jgi:arginyl-tRNA synthetase